MTPVLQALLGIEQTTFSFLVVWLLFVLWSELSAAFRTFLRPVGWLVSASAIFAAFFMWFASSFGADGWAMAMALATGIALSVASPVFALCFVSAVLLLRPWEIASEDSTLLALPRLFAALLVASWAFNEGRDGKFHLRFGLEEGLLGAFVAWTYVSIFVAPSWSVSHGTFLVSYTRSFVIYFLILQIVRTPRHVFALATSIGFCGATLATLTGYRMAYDPLLQSKSRAELFGLLGDPNDLSAVLLLALPLLVYTIDRAPWAWIVRRMVQMLALGLALWTIMLTQSRGAIVGFLCLVLGWGISKVRTPGQAFAGIALVLLLGLGLSQSLTRSADDLSSSQASRIAYWKAGWSMAVRNPLLGVGFGGYPYRFSEFVDPGVSEIGRRTAHSTWVLALAETGFVGFGLFVSLFSLALWRAWIVRRNYPYLLPALAGYGGAATFLSHTYVLHPYLLLALTFAAYRTRESPEDALVSQE